MIRLILGIVFLGFAVMVMGPMILMAGLNPLQGLEDAPSNWVPLLFFLIPGFVLISIGVLLVGRRYWADAVGWTLVATALYGLVVSIMMYSFIMSPESSEMFASMELQNPQIFDKASISVFPPLAIGLTMLVTGLPLAGWRFKSKLMARSDVEVVKHEGLVGVDSPRPISVAVVSWVLLVTSVFGLLSWFALSLGFNKTIAETTERIWGLSSGIQITWGTLGSLTMLVCGLFLLQGKNWARWTIVGYFAVNLIVSSALFKSIAFVVPGIAWTAVFYYFLFFRKPASQYFGRDEKIDD